MEGSGTHAPADTAAGVAHDRLSDLPDCLLHTILSRLGSRQVVQTCVLSRRWRKLWRSVPVIDLDDREFLSTTTPAKEDPGNVEEKIALGRFEDFAETLLFRVHHAGSPASPLDAFRLSIGNNVIHHTNYARWIRRGLACAPAGLDIRNGAAGDCFRIELIPSVPLRSRRLTRLRLDNVTLEDKFMEQLDTLFPVLGDLELMGCSFSLPRTSRIASGTLKNLTVDNCRQRYASDSGCLVAIVAPRLATLRLAITLSHEGHGYANPLPSFTAYNVRGATPAASLARASVRVVGTDRYLDYVPPPQPQYQNLARLPFERNMAFLKSVCKLVGSLSGARCLELSGLRSVVVEKKEHVTLEDRFVSVPMLQAILDDEQQGLPVFGNLQTLVLGECDLGDDWQALRRFLQNTPALENLHLLNCKFPDGLQRTGGRNRQGIASNLKFVEITYKDDEHVSALPEEYREEHAREFYEVLADISQELQTTVKVIKV